MVNKKKSPPKVAAVKAGKRRNAQRAFCTMTSATALATALHGVRSAKGKSARDAEGQVAASLSIEGQTQLLRTAQSELCRGQYKCEKLRWRKKWSGEKSRYIAISTVRDRVVYRVLGAAIRTVVPTVAGNYSGPGFGRVAALHAMSDAFAHEPNEVQVVRTDIAQCFDSVDLARVLRALEAFIGPGKFMSTLRGVLKHGSTAGKGILQGSSLSPALIDVLLHDVDLFFLRRKTCWYARYVDDFCILVQGTPEQASAVLAELRAKLRDLGLDLNDRKTTVGSADHGFDYLGVHVQRTPSGTKITPTKESVRRLCNKLTALTDHEEARLATARWVAQFTALGNETREAATAQAAAALANWDTAQRKPHPQQPPSQDTQRRDTGITAQGLLRLRAPAATIAAFGVGRTVRLSEPDCLSSDLKKLAPSHANNAELGLWHEKIRSAQVFWGQALQQAQTEVHQCRVRRAQMRALLACEHKDVPAARALARSPAHEEVTEEQRHARQRARAANDELSQLQAMRRSIENEMLRRTQAAGIEPMPGQIHMTKLKRRERAWSRAAVVLARSMTAKPRDPLDAAQGKRPVRNKNSGGPKKCSLPHGRLR